MGSEWKQTTIGDELTLQRGFDITRKQQRPGDVPVVSSGGIASYHDTAKQTGPGVIMGRKGSLGTVFYVEQDYWPHDTTLWIKDFHGNDERFSYYFFKDFASHLLSMDVGAANPTLNRNHVHPIEISWPPLPEQKAITHILGTLDDKIELNRRKNATLEGMAQAIFKSWFVDFDPVIDNALAAGNPIPDELAPRAEVRRQALANGTTQQGSVDHPTLSDPKSLFPAAFQFTDELGWIPEGWEVGSISDLAALNPESWTAKKHPDSVNYVDLANTKDGRINETTAYEFGEAPSRARRVLKQHDTIIGTVRPGNRSFAYIHDDGLTGSTGFAVLRPNEAASRSFIYLGLTRDEVIEVFAHLADGAAYPAIRPEVVGNTQITVPCSEVLQLFEDQAAPLIAKVGAHQKEAETLSRVRDTLLPKLISGELKTTA